MCFYYHLCEIVNLGKWKDFFPSAFSSASKVPKLYPCCAALCWNAVVGSLLISVVDSNSWNFQFQSSFSSWSFLFGTLLFPFISFLMPFLPPKQLPCSSWAPEGKPGAHWGLVALLSVPLVPAVGGTAQSLLSPCSPWNVPEHCTEPLNWAQCAQPWETKIWIHGLERLELLWHNTLLNPNKPQSTGGCLNIGSVAACKVCCVDVTQSRVPWEMSRQKWCQKCTDVTKEWAFQKWDSLHL